MTQGKPQLEIEQLSGRSDKPISPSAFLGQQLDPTTDRFRVQWLVKAQQRKIIKVIVRHDHAGYLAQALTLD